MIVNTEVELHTSAHIWHPYREVFVGLSGSTYINELTTKLLALDVIAKAFVFKRSHLLFFGCSLKLGLLLSLNPHACFAEKDRDPDHSLESESRGYCMSLQLLPLIIIVVKHRGDVSVFSLYSSSFVFGLQCCCHGAMRSCISKGNISVSGTSVHYKMPLSPKQGLFLAHYYVNVLAM